MGSALFLIAFLTAGGGALYFWQSERLRRLAMARIGLQIRQESEGIQELYGAEARALIRFPRRYYWAPPLLGLAAGATIFWGSPLPAPYAVGAAVLFAAIGHLFEVHWADRQIETMESQLADAIDLMVASLRAGSALLAALEATVQEARQPMREELETMVGRIRVGDDPREVVRELALRVPLESFRLFSHTLLVHWETGGGLASTLRTVGRTVRDRLEVSRRISAQAVESQLSVVAVMAITYGLALFTLHSNPGPFLKLLYSQIGSYAACGLMILQAIGMNWIWRMSRIRF